MEEVSTMEEGYDDRGGSVLVQEAVRQWEGRVLDQDMGVGVASLSSDQLEKGIRGTILEEELHGVLDKAAGAVDSVEVAGRNDGVFERREATLENQVEVDEEMRQPPSYGDPGDIPAPREKVLDWKEAVLGKKGAPMADFDDNAEKGVDNDNAEKKVDDVWRGRSCRDLVFNEQSESYLAADGFTVNMDVVAAAKCEVRLGKALVGKILGRPVPYGFLNRDLKRKWGKFGRIQMSFVGKNCFVCFFETEVIRDSVLRGGPWFVGNQLVAVDKWSVEFDPSSSLKGFSSPIWVRFPGLPLHYWSDNNLGRLASMIGDPLWVDEATSFWGRTEFARVCVRLDLARKLPNGVWVNGTTRKFFQKVVYEGIDQVCFKCGVIGHVSGDCGGEGKGKIFDGVQNSGGVEQRTENGGVDGLGKGTNGVFGTKVREDSHVGNDNGSGSTVLGRTDVERTG